jgi:hypothetical protein
MLLALCLSITRVLLLAGFVLRACCWDLSLRNLGAVHAAVRCEMPAALTGTQSSCRQHHKATIGGFCLPFFLCALESVVLQWLNQGSASGMGF